MSVCIDGKKFGKITISMEGQVKHVGIIERVVAFRRLGAYQDNVSVLTFDSIDVLYCFHQIVCVSPR